jgi:hypothetical protein
MTTNGTVAFWRIAGIAASIRIPHINKPSPKSRFEEKYIGVSSFQKGWLKFAILHITE